MWVWHIQSHWRKRYEVRLEWGPQPTVYPSETYMMIPGTYAEMRADYD